jgi:hypothetical protein
MTAAKLDPTWVNDFHDCSELVWKMPINGTRLRRGMSRTKNQYNGRVIHVTSFPLADNRFTVHFDIEKQRDGRIEVTHFESGQSFASDAEAIEAGLKMAQQKIDSDSKPAC